MTENRKIIQCVPNFSEGRDSGKVERILDCFRGREGVSLLDYSSDHDHNRMVVTLIGEPHSLADAVHAAIGTAVAAIDLRSHQGQHPRMGAVDVVPFIPVRNASMEDAVALSKQVARRAAEAYRLPVFLYEASAVSEQRRNLADIRKGQFEGMAEKMKDRSWQPDFGPSEPHPSAGVTAIGARMPLIAFNVNLRTDDLSIADGIARKVRHLGGGLRFCKAIGVELKGKGQVQVSMNLTDYTQTALYQAVEMIRFEAASHGVSLAGSELIGLAPMAALIDSACYYLGLHDFSLDQVLESRLLE